VINQADELNDAVLVCAAPAADDKFEKSESAKELWQQEQSQSGAVRAANGAPRSQDNGEDKSQSAVLAANGALLSQYNGKDTLKEHECSAAKFGHCDTIAKTAMKILGHVVGN